MGKGCRGDEGQGAGGRGQGAGGKGRQGRQGKEFYILDFGFEIEIESKIENPKSTHSIAQFPMPKIP
jgi:hypothetical protein